MLDHPERALPGACTEQLDDQLELYIDSETLYNGKYYRPKGVKRKILRKVGAGVRSATRRRLETSVNDDHLAKLREVVRRFSCPSAAKCEDYFHVMLVLTQALGIPAGITHPPWWRSLGLRDLEDNWNGVMADLSRKIEHIYTGYETKLKRPRSNHKCNTASSYDFFHSLVE